MNAFSSGVGHGDKKHLFAASIWPYSIEQDKKYDNKQR
jgi:hypothetical protein